MYKCSLTILHLKFNVIFIIIKVFLVDDKSNKDVSDQIKKGLDVMKVRRLLYLFYTCFT